MNFQTRPPGFSLDQPTDSQFTTRDTYSSRLSAVVGSRLFSYGQAQSSNLTIASSPAIRESCASPSNASEIGAITFTTAGVPILNHCFNLDEVFRGSDSGNNTFTVPTGFTTSGDPSVVHYVLSNREAFDPAANYSHVYYQQSFPVSRSQGSEENDLPDNTAARLFQLYSGQNCENAIEISAPEGQNTRPWYAYSCVSDGQCNVAAFSVKSFLVGDATTRLNLGWGDKRRDFAYSGNGARLRGNAGWAGAMAIVVLTWWM